jgi:hypothetical protein
VRRIAIAVFLLCSPLVFGSDIYFAASSAGSNNGTSCSNAYAYNDGTNGISKSVNWVAGNTLHVCGTISLSANTNAITAQASGSSGNPITIKFESGAILQAPYFGTGANAGIYLSGYNYITINGANTGKSSTYPTVPTFWTGGVLQNYANGDSGQSNCPGINNTYTGACSNSQTNTHLIEAMGSNNIVVENLFGLTQVVTTGTSGNGAPGSDCVEFQGSNVTITNNQFYFCGNGVDNTSYHTDSNTVISNNYFSQNGWGIGCAGALFTNTNYQVSGNWFHNFSLYQNTTAHVNGIHCYNGSGGGIASFYLYNNIFDGSMGTGGWTAWVYLESDGAGDNWNNNTGTLYAFNNIFVDSVGLGNASLQTGGGVNHLIVNNVFWGCNQSGCAGASTGKCLQTGGTGMIVENNVFVQCAQITTADNHSGQTPSFTTWDYNVYGQAISGNSLFQFNAISQNTFSGWQSACSCDAHGQAASNNLASAISNITSAGVPSAGYIGLVAGANLTSTATGNLASLATGTTAANSITGEARPNSAWDVGAYEISNGGSTYTITISSITGNGTVTSSDSVINCTTGTTGTCSDSGATGTITLTESPSNGYSFSSWGGGTCSGNSSTCTITDTATVTATFTINPISPAVSHRTLLF